VTGKTTDKVLADAEKVVTQFFGEQV
jgi:hypothetical protein